MMTVVERTIRGVEAYVRVQTLIGLMIAGVSGAVMSLVGLDNALFWTLRLFLLCYIPILGVAIGSVAPACSRWCSSRASGRRWRSSSPSTSSPSSSSFVLPKMQADAENIDPSACLAGHGRLDHPLGVPGAFLAIPLTFALMYQLAQFDSLLWAAIFISNDGQPFPTSAPIRRPWRATSRSEEKAASSMAPPAADAVSAARKSRRRVVPPARPKGAISANRRERGDATKNAETTRGL